MSTKYAPVSDLESCGCAAAAVAPAAAAPAAAVLAARPTIAPAALVRTAAVNTTPTAHAINPFAVSRKNTSSVCTCTHRVRSRPARYPVIAEEHRWVKIIQTIPAIATFLALAPSYAHGETADSPRPVPSTSRM